MDLSIPWKNTERTFIIAEIGQNHQGDINIAKQLIKAAKEFGADCAKFQKTNLQEKFNIAALKRPYPSIHSFGKTYGEHKARLEFTENNFKDLQNYAREIGILFTASAMDSKSLSFLVELDVPFIKIGSGDANNFSLIEKAAETNIPLIISTGMQSFATVKEIYHIVSKYHKNFALLHCISAYPAPLEDINLNVINLFKSEFPDITIGYSGHELGTHISTAAVALGCKIIERHLTVDKKQKGSDHACSLEPEELQELVSNIRTLEIAMGKPTKAMRFSEKLCYEKLGKSLVYAKPLKEGYKLGFNDLITKVAEPKGIDGSEIRKIVGKILAKDVLEDESVLKEHLL
nr:sialic acid synthase [Leptinotarsa decemlineata]